MKPIHLIAGLGGLAIAGVLGWYLHMQSTLPYETTTERGVPIAAGTDAPASAAPATAAPATAAAPATDAPAPEAAPGSEAEAPATDAP